MHLMPNQLYRLTTGSGLCCVYVGLHKPVFGHDGTNVEHAASDEICRPPVPGKRREERHSHSGSPNRYSDAGENPFNPA